jgi:hypothetical protein
VDKFDIAKIVEDYGFTRIGKNKESDPVRWQIKPNEHKIIDLGIADNNFYLSIDEKDFYCNGSEDWKIIDIIRRCKFNTEEELKFLLEANLEIRQYLKQEIVK